MPGVAPPLPGAPFALGIVPPPIPLPPGPPPAGFSQVQLPPPPPGFPSFTQQPQIFIPPPPGGPPGRQWPRQPRVLQDPLSSTPHSTYQGHRAMRQNMAMAAPASSSMPVVSASRPPTQAVGVISAEPELRDLKREATAFVPTAVKRRKVTATQQIKTRMNAAPNAPHEDNDDDEGPVQGPQRPDLVATLRNAGVGAQLPENGSPQKAKIKDDYDDFLAEVGDILE